MHTAYVRTGMSPDSLLDEARADPVKNALLIPEFDFPSVKEMFEQIVAEDKAAGSA